MCVEHVTRCLSCGHKSSTISACAAFDRLSADIGFGAPRNDRTAHCGAINTRSYTSDACGLCAKRSERESTSRSERPKARGPEPGRDGKQKSTSKTSRGKDYVTGAIRGLFGPSRNSKPQPVKDIRVLKETAQGTVPHLRMRDTQPSAPPSRTQTLRPREQTAAEPRGRTRTRDPPIGGSRPAEASARSGTAPFMSSRERRAKERADISAPGPSEPQWPHLSRESPDWPLLGHKGDRKPLQRTGHVRVTRSPGGTRTDPRERIARRQDQVPELVRSARVTARQPVITKPPSEHSLRGEIGFVQAGTSSRSSSSRPVDRRPPSGMPARKPMPPNALPRRTTSKSSSAMASGSRARPAVPPAPTAFPPFPRGAGHYEFSGAELDPTTNRVVADRSGSRTASSAFARETGHYEFSGAELDPSINPAVANRSTNRPIDPVVANRPVSPVSPTFAPRRPVSPLSVRHPSVREPDHVRAEQALRRQNRREQGHGPTVAAGGSHQVRLPVQPMAPPSYSGRHPAVPTPQSSGRPSVRGSSHTTTPNAARHPVPPPPSSNRERDSMYPRPLQVRRVQAQPNLQPSRPSEAVSGPPSRYVPNPIFANQTCSQAPSRGERSDRAGSGSFSRGLRRMFHRDNADDDAEWVCKSSSNVERGSHRR